MQECKGTLRRAVASVEVVEALRSLQPQSVRDTVKEHSSNVVTLALERGECLEVVFYH